MKKIFCSIALFTLLFSLSILPSSKDSKENVDLRSEMPYPDLSASVELPNLRGEVNTGLSHSIELGRAKEKSDASKIKDEKENRDCLKKSHSDDNLRRHAELTNVKENRKKALEARKRKSRPTKEDYIIPKPWLNIWVATGLNCVLGFVTGWLSYNQFQALGKLTTHKIVSYRNPHLPKVLESINKPTTTLTDRLEFFRINNEFVRIETGLQVTAAVVGAGLFAWRAYTSAKAYLDQYNTKKTYNQRYKQLEKEDPLQAHRLRDLPWKPLNIDQIIKNDDEKGLREWLEYKKHKINRFDKDGKTPLYKAAVQNKLKVAKLLLDNGAKNEKTAIRVSPLQAVHWLGQMKHSVDGGKYKEMHALLVGQ